MGCKPSKEAADPARQKSDAIDQQLRMDSMQAARQIKCLLLGSGESGKSTILKQMQLIHGKGYSAAERAAYREVIFSNVVQSMKVILVAMPSLGLTLHDPATAGPAAHTVLAQPNQVETPTLDPMVAHAIAVLWNDAGVRAAYARASEFQLNDSARYYFEAVDRLADPNYLPNDQDILRSRVKTTGIVETVFKVNDLAYHMFDVGGQRSERKKWIHCFENVTAIIFMVAISEYDQVLIEDENVNRMHEALNLFESICNSRWFVDTSIILFLNKIDLFKEKLAVTPVNKYFPDYEGPNDFQTACHFFLRKFTDLNTNAQYKSIYAHFTCATDTMQIKFVFSAINDILIRKNLEDAGLL
ncbi:hypothetical protein AMAG_06540 [Allomyces macrogynus ATCC 38327]|uniref:Guanine nucleotide-binding protein subunit alpha n=1 Tax=Allomyces macrogynus (strain ATCC 38327) TaxID=578462 RepID=A0A0L0SH11_ALLM3|nr:guanine nucleotide-binding protein subunit alpha [Allomyces arbusculus]KNE61739.1 hypothetical protein AMAG_06540 [Allomyces macrogynus ATCC 38327]|eukprot:KNE61739.1 hypothetical protein AMAG_06540 [Allomyces macrogynus ATCC 38327]